MYMMSISVYSFKSMGYAVDDSYLPESLRCRYVPSCLLGKGACGEVRLAYDKVSLYFNLLLARKVFRNTFDC